ncbi:hypothetical protein QFZ91_001570 [Paraburkholderia sp. JPY419]
MRRRGNVCAFRSPLQQDKLDGIPQTRRLRRAGQPDWSRHDDVGRAEHRAGSTRADRLRARSRREPDRHRRNVSGAAARRNARFDGALHRHVARAAQERAREDRARHQDRGSRASAAQSAPYSRRRQPVRPQEPDRGAQRQPQTSANGLRRSVSAALARSQHDDLRPCVISVGRRRVHGADRGNADCARRIREGWQGAPSRRVERNAVGCRAISARGRKARLATHRQHPESVQPVEPHVRSGSVRVRASRQHRSARVLAACVRLAVGQVRRRRTSGRRTHHAVRALRALQQAASRAGDHPLCRAREAPRHVARAIRARVRQQPAVRDQQSDRRDVARAVEGKHRASADVKLSPEVLAEIDKLHELQPNPAP